MISFPGCRIYWIDGQGSDSDVSAAHTDRCGERWQGIWSLRSVYGMEIDCVESLLCYCCSGGQILFAQTNCIAEWKTVSVSSLKSMQRRAFTFTISMLKISVGNSCWSRTSTPAMKLLFCHHFTPNSIWIPSKSLIDHSVAAIL